MPGLIYELCLMTQSDPYLIMLIVFTLSIIVKWVLRYWNSKNCSILVNIYTYQTIFKELSCSEKELSIPYYEYGVVKIEAICG